MPVKFLQEALEQNVEEAFNEIAPKEDLSIDVQVQLAPLNNGQGMMPVAIIMVQSPSGILDQDVFIMATLPLGMTNDASMLKERLRAVIEQMASQRSQMIATAGNSLPEINQSSPGGILLP